MHVAFLSLDGENIVIKKDENTSMRLPLHNLEDIFCFSYAGTSPALMGACAERSIGLCYFSPYGRFQARVTGKVKGNVLLRKKQYAVSEVQDESVPIAASFLLGKIANCRKVLDRALPPGCGTHEPFGLWLALSAASQEEGAW